MIAIAVDDEPLMLGALTKAIKASDDITFVADFTSCEEALEYIKSNPSEGLYYIGLFSLFNIGQLYSTLFFSY